MKFFSKGKIKNKSTKSSNRKILFVTLLCCLVVFIIVLSLKPKKEISTKEKEVKRRVISVERIIPSANVARINLFGEAIPEWKATIKSRVEGVIIFLSPNFRVGAKVKKNEVLLEVENSQYLAFVADAEVRLSNAKNSLLIEEKETKEAKQNWKRSGFKGEPESSLVFRLPQLEIARNELKAAEALLKKAKFDLSQTKIRAPYDGSIVERNISLGESIFPGEVMALLYGDTKIFVEVDLNENQWNLLPQIINEAKVSLISSKNGSNWNAKIARIGNWLNNESRLRPVIIELNNVESKNPLLAGTFLNVELYGKTIPNTFMIDETAMTKGGYVWYVNQDNILKSYKPQPHFYVDGKICLSMPNESSGNIRVAVNPNSTYINGFKVKPQIANKGE